MKIANTAHPMAVLLTLAFLIRLAIALAFPNIIAPDEMFQALEQAHRLVFGQGIIPWEFQVGLRCWLIPLLLAIPMQAAHLAFQNPLAGLILIRAILCAASLSIVWCAAGWGQRFHGRSGFWLAGGLAALWPDFWLMAPHPLEEILAADLLVPALYLVESPATRSNATRIALAGFLLGAAFTLRIQLAPAIAIAGIALCRRDPRAWRLALLAAALPFLAAGMIDWVTWGQPFRSFWLNIYLNVVLGIANGFGTPPPSYFIFMLGLDWLWTLPVMLYLTWRGATRLPIAGIASLAIILTHSLIAHKEYRFVFPAIALAVPLAGVGLGALWASLQTRAAIRLPRLCLGLVLLIGPLCSPWIYFMLQWETDSFWAFYNIAKLPAHLVSVEQLQKTINSTGPLFLPDDLVFPSTTRLTRQTLITTPAGTTQADAIIAAEHSIPIPPGFHLQACYPGIWIPFSTTPAPRLCAWTRPPDPSAPAAALPFEFPFPPKAKPYTIPNHLFEGS